MKLDSYEFRTGEGLQLTDHFNSDEFQCKCGVVHVHKMSMSLVDRLESLRLEIGIPIKINSGYRCETYNAKIGGAKSSYHVQGLAADLDINDYLIRLVIARWGFRIGLYDTFTHIDMMLGVYGKIDFDYRGKK